MTADPVRRRLLEELWDKDRRYYDLAREHVLAAASTPGEYDFLRRHLPAEGDILEVGCDDYKQLLGAGKVDYARLLGMITKHLRGKAERLVKLRTKKPAAAKKRGRPRRLVVVYGGALHNDLYPYDDLKDFTFGQALKQRTGGRYVEVDLYVPEYVEKDKNLAKERWFPLLRLASPRGVVLIERGVGSYILLLRRGIAP